MNTKSARNRLAGALAGLALVLATLGSAAPATAAPAGPVTVTAGLGTGSYSWWCNWYGTFCKKALHVYSWGSYEDVCSDLWCSQFHNSKHHPHPSRISKISKVIYHR